MIDTLPEAVRKYVYHSEPSIVILHGDCLEILPLLEAGSVDMILTDPPYLRESLYKPMITLRMSVQE